MVALKRHSISGLADAHRGMAGQQLNHHAFVGRVEMLDENERHAVTDGEALHELSTGIEAARRGAHPDDQKVIPAPRRAAHRHRSPVRSSTRRFGLGWTPSGHFVWTVSGNAPSWNRLLHSITGSLPVRPEGIARGNCGHAGRPVAEWAVRLRSFRACYWLSHIGYGSGHRGLSGPLSVGVHVIGRKWPAPSRQIWPPPAPSWRFAHATDPEHALREHPRSVRRASE